MPIIFFYFFNYSSTGGLITYFVLGFKPTCSGSADLAVVAFSTLYRLLLPVLLISLLSVDPNRTLWYIVQPKNLATGLTLRRGCPWTCCWQLLLSSQIVLGHEFQCHLPLLLLKNALTEFSSWLVLLLNHISVIFLDIVLGSSKPFPFLWWRVLLIAGL